MCRAKDEVDHHALCKQLRNLYDLDPCIFRECLHHAIPRHLWSVLLRSVVDLGPGRSEFSLASSRLQALVRATGLVTKDLETIDLWHIKVKTDTNFIRSVGCSLRKRLPSDVRAHIAEFACSDLRELHRSLCSVKSKCYHVLSKPMFWHFVYDPDADDTCHQMIGVHVHSVRAFHQPNLSYLKDALRAHRRVAATSFCHRRAEWCDRSVEICTKAGRASISNDHPLRDMLQMLYS